MVGVSASVKLPLHHKVQKFSSGTGSPGQPLPFFRVVWKKGTGKRALNGYGVVVSNAYY